jgi:hypothetical protein
MLESSVPVSKDESAQTLVPLVWRSTLCEIVRALSEGDMRLERGLVGVSPIPVEDAEGIKNNISRYGAHLIPLPEAAWQTSACQWMGDWWDLLVDLFTAEEGPSDLVLGTRIYEMDDGAYRYEVLWVHVP